MRYCTTRLFLPLLSLLITISSFSPFIQTTKAATNATINYQARILNLNGSLVADGDYHIEFKIYDHISAGATAQGACSGNCAWVETRTGANVVRVVNGYVSVNLGSVTAFPVTMPWDQDLYVTMRVGGSAGGPVWDTEMTNSGNRMKTTAAPYAFRAAQAFNVFTDPTSTASTNTNSIGIQTGNATGLTSNSGDIAIDSGTATGTTGTISLGATNSSGINLGRSGITTQILGATLNGTTALLNFPANAPIGTAVATVDARSSFVIPQTSVGIALTLPSPTSTTAGRIAYVANTGTNSFTLNGTTVATGTGVAFMWNGSAWSIVGGGSGGSTTIQQAYDNAVGGIITVTAADGALRVRDAAVTFGNANIFSVQNNAGAVDYLAVQGDGDVAFDTNTLFVDATNNRVGIGTAAPTAVLQVTNAAPVAAAGATGTAQILVSNLAGGVGGSTTIATTGAGGAGGGLTYLGGTGGTAASALTASTGGAGGATSLTSGSGGAAAVAGVGNNTGGNGGAFTLQSGAGGNATGATSGINTAGNGGAFTLQAGTGGTATTGSGNLVGGAGGTLSLSGGTGGVGTTSGGSGGAVTLQGGTAAAMAGAAGGAATVAGRAGSATGSGGAGGALSLTAGAAGGDNTVSRAGGAVTISAGASRGSSVGGLISLTAGAGGGGTGTAGSNGGAITLTGGTGGVGSLTGGNGGAVTLQAGAAAASDGSAGGAASVAGAVGTSTLTGGNGGALSLTAGAAGGDNTVSRAGGAVTLSAGSSRGASVGGTITVTAGSAGSNLAVAASVAGAASGGITFNAGNGGIAPNATTLSTGGAAGGFTVNGGSGGAASVAGTVNNTGGGGGTSSFTGGTGGIANGATSGINTGGTGGAFTFQGGTGGAANTGSGSLIGGTGGALTFSGGTGGLGATSGGNGGGVTIQGGAASAMAGAAGGAVSISGRAGSVTGTGGNGGALTLSGGAAGGNGLVARTGGSLSLSAGASNGGAAGGAVTLTAGLGGNNATVGTATGGNAGGIIFNGSNGGTAANATTSSTGGTAGGFTINGGTGGSAAVAGTGSNTGGNGGAFAWTAGNGGAANGATSGINTGGLGGTISLVAGNGGAATTGSGTLAGGAGGGLILQAGSGGAGATTAGLGGALTLRGGVSGAASSVGGDIILETALNTTRTERMRVTNSGYVGIGTGTTTSLPNARLTVVAENTTTSQIKLRSSRSALVANDVVGGLDFDTNDTNLTIPGLTSAKIQAVATATHTAAVNDTALVFSTATGLTLAERWRINSTGELQGNGASTLRANAANLTLGTLTSGNVVINGAGTFEVQDDINITSNQFTNSASTVNTAQAVANAGSVAIGASAATTVDVDTAFILTQTTAGTTKTLHTPTNTTAGRMVYVTNSPSSSTTFTLYSVVIPVGATQGYIWNGSAWTASNVAGAGSGVTTVGAIDSQTKSADGAVILGSTIYMQTADLTNSGLVSTTTQSIAGAKTFSALLSGTAGLDVSGAITNINASSNFNTNINTGSSTGTLNIGNSASSTVLLGTTSINSSGIAGTNIGNGTGTLALTGATTLNGSFTQSGAVSFSTGTGAVNLNGNTSITGSNTLTVSSGLTTLGGGLTVTGTSTFTGNLIGNGAASGVTATATATPGVATTTINLTAGAFADNDVIFINNAGQDYYTRIVSGGGTAMLTVSPAVDYDASVTVERYSVQNIGATATDYTTQANRFFQGYFLGGVVVGSGSTTLSDGKLSRTTGDIVINPGAGGVLQVNGTINATTITGDGTGITNIDSSAISGATITGLDATNISTGTLSDAQLSANVVLLSGSQSFSGLKTFSSGATISAGQTLSVNGDAFTDLTGTGLQINSGVLETTLGTNIDLGTAEVTGMLGTGNGGTGANSAQGAINAISGLTTTGDLQYFNGTNTTRLARGSNGDCLTSNGTTIVWGSCSAGTSFTLSGSTGTPQTLNAGDTITIAAGSNVTTTAGTTDTITIDIASAPTFAGLVTASSFSGDGSALTTLDGTNISSGTVADARLSTNVVQLNLAQSFSALKTFGAGATITTGQSFTVNGEAFTDLTGTGLTLSGNSLAVSYGSSAGTAVEGNTGISVTAGNGLSGGGAITLGAGGTVTLDVAYGSSANTAVQGNVGLTCPSGSGNLTGGGGSITLGAGGSCGAISTNNAVSFSTSVTSPSFTSSGAISLTSGGANTVTIDSGGVAGVTIAGTNASSLALGNSGATTTINGSTIVLGTSVVRRTAVGTTDFEFNDTANTTLNISNTDPTAVANIIIEGSVTAASLAGSGTGLTALSATNVGSGTLNDGRLSSNIATLTGAQSFAGLKSFDGGATITTGQSFTLNGDAFTDLTGTGLTISSGSLAIDTTYFNANYLQLGSAVIQSDATANSTIGVDKTNATGNLITLQRSGVDAFTVGNSGALQIRATSTTGLDIQTGGGVSTFSVDTSGNIVRIGNLTADTTGVLLVMDSKNTTGDPSIGTENNGQYYNSADNKNRCYENGIWTDCMTLRVLGETTLGAAANTIDVPLTADVEYLHCRIDTKGQTAAGTVFLRFNNISAAGAYQWNTYSIAAAAVVDAQDNNDTEMQLTGTDADTDPMSADIKITNFADRNKSVDWTSVISEPVNTNNNRYSGGGVYYNVATQISSVQFVTSASTFAAGSHAWCEGRDIR